MNNKLQLATFSLHQHGFAHLLLLFILLFAAVGGIGYYTFKNGKIRTISQSDLSSPSVADTWLNEATLTLPQNKNWKIYRNEDYRFQFKFPPDILTLSECLDGVNIFPADSKIPWSQHCNSPFITFVYSPVEFSVEQPDPASYEVTSEKIAVAGQEATKLTVRKINNSIPGQDLKIYVQLKNDKYFMLTLKQQRFENEFNQILSTFEFTD